MPHWNSSIQRFSYNASLAKEMRLPRVVPLLGMQLIEMLRFDFGQRSKIQAHIKLPRYKKLVNNITKTIKK